jgi:FtsH-binding integral membrane protein
MAYPAYSHETPVADAPAESRIAFLRRVAGLTFVGLSVSALTSMVAASIIMALGLFSTVAQLVIIFGSYAIAHYGARSLVFSESTTTKYLGFFMGSVFQGIAMGYLVLTAVLMSSDLFGNPFVLIFQALSLVGLTTVGLTAYLLTGPKNLSFIGAGLAALTLPMLALMALTFVFPMNGVVGVLVSLLFVGVSVGGLLYQLNSVMHQLPTRMHVEASYVVMMGVLVLFWNILVLIMRLQSRD